jgi:hypothetical protein
MNVEEKDITIAFLLLAHDQPSRLQLLIEKIISEDKKCEIIIHYDRNSQLSDFKYIKSIYESNDRIHFLQEKDRIKCEWGKFSIVQATLNMISFGIKSLPHCNYYYLLSGACFPIKPLCDLRSFLAKNSGVGFMESNDSKWIKNGIREDRYLYHHFFNFRKHPWVFRRLYWLQRRLLLRRRLPYQDVHVYFGSQWWCLPSDFLRRLTQHPRKKKIDKFFKYTWIPDECYFQTMIDQCGLSHKIRNHSLTHYVFDSSGKPINVKLNDSYNYLTNKYFIRKICV